MNESSTNIYRVPAKVISTGSGLSTVYSKCMWSETCYFFVVMHLKSFSEIMLFLCLDFSPWYLRMLLVLQLLSHSSLVGPGW